MTKRVAEKASPVKLTEFDAKKKQISDIIKSFTYTEMISVACNLKDAFYDVDPCVEDVTPWAEVLNEFSICLDYSD